MNTEAITATCNLINQITMPNAWSSANHKFTQMRVRQRMEELMHVLHIDVVKANKRLLISPELVCEDDVFKSIKTLIYLQQHFVGLLDSDIEPVLAVVLSNLGIPKAGPIEL